MKIVLTGEPICATEAYGFGPISEVCADGAALSRTLEIAVGVVAMPPLAVREKKLSKPQWAMVDFIVAPRLELATVPVSFYVVGFYQAVAQTFRFAATNTASQIFRPNALSWVMMGGVFSAILWPQPVNLTVDL